MKNYSIRPYDADEAYLEADTIEEARAKRSELAMSFIIRRVVIIDNNTGEEVE